MSERRRKDWRTNRAIANLETARVRFGLDPGAGVPPDYLLLSEAVTKLAIVFERRGDLADLIRDTYAELFSDALVGSGVPYRLERVPPR